MNRIFFGGAAALFLAFGCTAETGSPDVLTKEDVAADVALGQAGPKADAPDWCEREEWYGDGICDWFCPLADQDCTGDECTVGADSTCDEGESCQPGVCLHYCAVGDPDCCEPATCQPRADFCSRVLCAPGTRCDEEAEECVPVGTPDFCTRAFCAPGTLCDEETDSCVPIGDCPGVLCALYCPYGFEGGDDGCPICRCADAPEPPICSPVLCELYCEYGFETGDDGCEVCSCAAPPAPDCPATGILCTPECLPSGRTPGGAPCQRGTYNVETCSCDPVPPAVGCRRGGCSSQLCMPDDMPPIFTTCEWRREYACIQQQTCERQANGSCGFTDTEASQACFDDL